MAGSGNLRMGLRRLCQLSSFVALLNFWATSSTACAADQVTVIGAFGEAKFKVGVADTPEERGQGLMFVEAMPRFKGMLFIYESPRHATFWMRNTLIPLDMLFALEDGTIATIHENAIPLDETTIDGGQDIQYVLEINGGMSATLGIAVGDVLQHPSIGEKAAEPCN